MTRKSHASVLRCERNGEKANCEKEWHQLKSSDRRSQKRAWELPSGKINKKGLLVAVSSSELFNPQKPGSNTYCSRWENMFNSTQTATELDQLSEMSSNGHIEKQGVRQARP